MPDDQRYFNAPLDPQSQMDAEDEYSARAKRAQSALENARTLDDVLSAYRDYAGAPAERGKLFERLIKRYLQVEPIYKAQFENVWLWNDWPDRESRDVGIDLVAKYHPDVNDGGLCAIQCKFYEPGRQVPGGDVATFRLAAQEIGAVGRIFVSTTDNIRPTDNKRFNDLSEPTTLLGKSDLERSAVRWPDIARPEDLDVDIDKFELRPDQREAIDRCIEGFADQDRGKLILPCGVGKTFTALKLAEEMVGAGGTVLYLVPSIALLSQAMREWSRQADPDLPHRYIGVCSDEKAGAQSEDARISELAMPVTTDKGIIGRALSVDALTKMTVVFCTYQSIGRIAEAQQRFEPRDFDLILCDEAHRTTGVEQSSSGKGASPFTMVHGQTQVRARKRLYMTATPRIYSPAAKSKAMKLGDVSLYSMDDESLYGPEFHRMSFAEAVDGGLLSDYRVLVLNISEAMVAAPLQRAISEGGAKELPLDDAVKLVGCASALFDPAATEEDATHQPLLRAISFSTTIKASKAMAAGWAPLVNESAGLLPESSRNRRMSCQVEHVDGKMNALERATKLDWLRESEDDAYEVRVLSNARCLSEGVDVPALDAVLFMQPRRSQVDVVQAVGRVMRTAPGKQYGYVILPIVIPADEDAAAALDNNKRYEVVWEVLQALRSHDERLDAEINQIDLNRAMSNRIQIVGVSAEPSPTSDAAIGDVPASFQYKLDGLVVDHFYARVVERVGDRQYWDKWAKDVAKIAATVQMRLRAMVPGNSEAASAPRAELRQRFDALLQAMRATTNDSLTEDGALAIVAQHMITGPVFNALYPDYDFTRSNPVARSLGEFVDSMGDHGLDAEMQGLQKFYDSVRRRAEGIDNPNGRRKVLEELYQNFFKSVMKDTSEQLGIVYTPHELVDFILHSVNDVLKEEFGKSLADEGVHILDPFAGMGTFIWRLIANPELIPDDALHRKYTEELHANEILPLAYYMATINIEEAYGERVARMIAGGNGHQPEYEPFKGIVWRDTFNAPTDGAGGSGRQATMQFMQANDARARRQDETEITVVVGNPPWKKAQSDENEDNPNVEYVSLELRIRKTYGRESRGVLRSSLFDAYKLAMRWATDRLAGSGVLGLVTNASFVTGNADSGLRAALAMEHRRLRIVNLRGNLRLHGEAQKQEGGNVFGNKSMVPVALTVIPMLRHQVGGSLLYRDIGDHLTASQKLRVLRRAKSAAGLENWRTVVPDDNHDWVNLGDSSYRQHSAIGHSDTRSGSRRDALFYQYSTGPATNKDIWVYDPSTRHLLARCKSMSEHYNSRLKSVIDTVDGIEVEVRAEPTRIKWDRHLKGRLSQRKWHRFDPKHVRVVEYRPFIRLHLFMDPQLIPHVGRFPAFFPEQNTDNTAIHVRGVGGSRSFSALAVGKVPDLHLNDSGQAFPRHVYDEATVTEPPNRVRGDIVQRNATQRNATQRILAPAREPRNLRRRCRIHEAVLNTHHRYRPRPRTRHEGTVFPAICVRTDRWREIGRRTTYRNGDAIRWLTSQRHSMRALALSVSLSYSRTTVYR